MEPFDWLKQKIGQGLSDIGHIATGVEHFVTGTPAAPTPSAPAPASGGNGPSISIAPPTATPNIRVSTPTPSTTTPSQQLQPQTEQLQAPTPVATPPAPVGTPVVSGVHQLSDINDALNNPLTKIQVSTTGRPAATPSDVITGQAPPVNQPSTTPSNGAIPIAKPGATPQTVAVAPSTTPPPSVPVAKPTQPNQPISIGTPQPPAVNDVNGLTQALRNIDQYSSDDQVRILSRSAQSGLISKHTAATYVNMILSPDEPQKVPSRASAFKEAAGDVLLPIATFGTSYLAKELGTNLGAAKVLDQVKKGNLDPESALAAIQQAESNQGTPLGESPGQITEDVGKQFAGSALQVGTAGLAGPVESGVESTLTRLGLRDIAGDYVTRLAAHQATGALTGAVFNIGGALSSNAPTTWQSIKSAVDQGLLFGGGIGTLTGLNTAMSISPDTEVDRYITSYPDADSFVKNNLDAVKAAGFKDATPEQLSDMYHGAQTRVTLGQTVRNYLTTPKNEIGAIGKNVNEPIAPELPNAQTFYTIHEGNVIKQVQGEPVSLVPGITTFIHPGTNGFVVSEASTGRYLAASQSREGAIAKARAAINEVGVDRFKQALKENKLEPPTVPVTKQTVGEPPINLTNSERLTPQQWSELAQQLPKREPTPSEQIMSNSTGTPVEEIVAQNDFEKYGKYQTPPRQTSIPGTEAPTVPTTTEQELAKPEVPSVGEILGEGHSRAALSGRALSTPNRLLGANLNDPGVYARVYNLPRWQAEKDFRDMAAQRAEDRELKRQNPGYKPGPSIAERRAIIASDPRQRTTNQVNLVTDQGNVRGAIAEATGIGDERMQRFNKALNDSDKLSAHDRDLMYRYDNGESIEDLAKEANKPALFKKAAYEAIDALDYSLAVDRAAGGATLRQSNYLPHDYRVSQEWLEAHKIPQSQWIKVGKEYGGFRDDHAEYGSYAEAKRKANLDPLYADPFEAIKKNATAGNNIIRDNLLATSLARVVPDHVADLNTVADNEGRRFSQAAGRLPFSVSDELQPYLRNFKSAKIDNRLGEAVLRTGEVTGGFLRKVAFLGAPIHYFNIGRAYSDLQIPAGHGVEWGAGIGEAVGSSFHPRVYQLLENRYSKPGPDGVSTREFARQNGFVERDTRPNLGRLPVRVADEKAGTRATAQKLASKYSPFGLAQRNMNRYINVLGWRMAEFAKEHGIKSGTPDAYKLFEEYNRVLDRLNSAAMGLDPKLERLTSAGSLAPHWIRANLGLVKEAVTQSIPIRIKGGENGGIAITKGGSFRRGFGVLNAGDVARTNVLGGRLLDAAFAILVTAIAAGHMPTLQKLIQEAGLKSNNPNPNIDLGEKNKKGESQVINLPSDPIGMTVGLFTDPAHFAIARESPLFSAVTKAVTNKDWNGSPLVDKNLPGWQEELTKKIIAGLAPFTVQNFTNPNVSRTQGVIELAGTRVKTNPNDPQVAANTAYFNTLSQEAEQLKKDNVGGYGQYWAQQFSNLHPANTTDVSGNKYPTPYNPVSSEQKYAAYTAVDSNGHQVLSPVFYADQKLNNMTPNYPGAPLYKLSGDGIDVNGNTAPRALVALQYQHAQDPAAKTVIMNANGGQNGWLAAYENQVADYSKNYQQNLTNYFQSLGWSQSAIDDYWSKHPSMADPIDQLSFDKPTTDLINQYYQLSASGDSTGASKFFSDNATVLGPAFDQIAQHSNAIRSAKGELQFQGYPAESDHVAAVMDSWPTGSDSASKKARALSINANPDVSQYLADIALYEALSKGAQFRYINPANPKATEGENINAGGQAGQTFLKDTVSLGNYDIAKNPTTGELSFMQGGTFPAGSTSTGRSGSGGSKKKPFVPRPRYPRQKRVKIQKPFIKQTRTPHVKVVRSIHQMPIYIKHNPELPQFKKSINLKPV